MSESETTKRLSDVIKGILIKRIESNRLNLPSISPVAKKIRELLEGGKSQNETMAALIGQDPILATLVFRAASSAAEGSRPPADLAAALLRLGEVRLMGVVVESMVKKLFGSKDSDIRKHLDDILAHSVAVAVVSQDIAKRINPKVTMVAYTVGLMHDVGKVIVANTLLDAEKELKDQLPGAEWKSAWLSIVDGIHQTIALALADKWKLPEMVQTALADLEDYDVDDRLAVRNIVILANSIAKQEGIYSGEFDSEDIAASIMMGTSLVGIDDAAVAELVSDLKVRVSEIVGIR